MKITYNHKFLSILVTIALVLSMVPIMQSSKAYATNVEQSTDISKYLGGRLKTQEELAKEVQNSSYVSLIDQSYYKTKTSTASSSNANETLPEKLDLRETGTVSSVKYQGDFGSCWAFSSNAAAETSLSLSLKASTGKTTALSGSAHQTSWFAFTPLSTDKSQLKGTEISQAGEGAYIRSGDNSMKTGAVDATAASLLFSGVGLTTQENIPYTDSNGTRDYENGDWSLTTDQRRMSIARASKSNDLGSVTTTDASGNWINTDNNVINSIKSELKAGHAVTIGYQADLSEDYDEEGNTMYFNYTNWCQYNYGTTKAEINGNHAVCIVGYDDNYPATNFNEGNQPPANGAFIVKNSWGGSGSTGEDYCDWWGIDDSGYFYLSYYDHSIKPAYTYEFDSNDLIYNSANLDDEIIDQYDYLQANSMLTTDLDDVATDHSTQGWYSNVFTASEAQNLHHIVTYYCEGGIDLDYRVYRLKSDATNPSDFSSATPVAQGTYSDEYAGYVSIKLDSAVKLNKGEKYAIWFSQRSNEGYYYYPRVMQVGVKYQVVGWSSNAVVNSGESFKSYNPELGWESLTDNTDDLGLFALDNYCVKGYATLVDPQPSSSTTVTVDSIIGSGTVKLNGIEVSNGSTVDVLSGKGFSINWKPGTASGNNVSIIKSIKLNGVEYYEQNSVDTRVWQSKNYAYRNKMNDSTAKMTTYDLINSTEQIATINPEVSADSTLSLTIEFEEAVPVYRLYNSITSEHLFTTNKAEYDNFVKLCNENKDAWIGEGIDWLAPTTGETVHRFYNAALGAMGRSSHYYSSNATEIATLLKNGWVDDGVANQIMSGGNVGIYTCYNEALGSAHHYTSSISEWRGLEQHGWALEIDKNGSSGVLSAAMSAKP